MKVGPSANYLVGVMRAEWDQESRPELYAGIFTVTLQTLVRIVFVPDVSGVAPPWTDAGLPRDLDAISTVDQARVVSALSAAYTVTPNPVLAGTVAEFVWPTAPQHGRTRVVRYVTAAEFGRFAVELGRLTEVAGQVYPRMTVGDLREFEVVQFVEREIVAAPWLRPAHAVRLGRDA